MLVIQGVKRAVESLAFHPDGNHLVAAGGYSDAVEYWSAVTGTKLREWTGPYGARQVRFSSAGRWLVCSGATSSPRSDEDFLTIDTKTWESVPVKTPDHPTYIAIAPVGDRIVVHDSGYYARLVCRTITASGIGRQLWAKYLHTRSHSHEWIVGGLDFFPAGDCFASVEYQFRDVTHPEPKTVLRTRSAASGSIAREVECPCEAGFDVRVSPDGDWVAFHSLTALHLIPTSDPAAQVKLRNPSRKHVTALAFHPSGRYLAVTSNDRTVRVHDRDAGWAVSHTYDWDIGKLKSVVFNADGTLAAAGGEKGSVVVWDVDG
jgi:WD40 repeat protein